MASLAMSQTPVITLQTTIPSGASAVQTTTLRLVGAHLDEADRLTFSHPGIHAEVLVDKAPIPELADRVRYGEFRITVDPEVVPGVYEVWAHGRMGVSNSRPLLITHLPLESIRGGATSQSAVAIQSMRWYHSTFRGKELDFYRLPVTQGTKYRFACCCGGLDSKAIPQITLRDDTGRILFRGRELQRNGVEFEWTAEANGEVTFECKEFLYRGGEDYPYAFMIAPLPDTTEPCQALRSVALVGIDESVLAKAIEDPNPSSKIELPYFGKGTWSGPGVPREFFFHANKDQTLAIDVLSNAKGQTTDPRCILEQIQPQADGSPKFQRIVVFDDRPNVGAPAMGLGVRDPKGIVKIPADGDYRLTLIDQQSESASNSSKRFWLSIRAAEPSWEAFAYFPNPTNTPPQSRALGTMLSKQGTISLHVVVRRDEGFDGPMQIHVTNPPPGVRCHELHLASGQSEGELILTSVNPQESWSGSISLVAKAEIGGKAIEKPVAFACWARDASAELGVPFGRLSSALWTHHSSKDLAPLLIRCGKPIALEGSEEVWTCKPGEKIEVPVTIERREGGAGAKCQLRPQNLPPKASMAEIAIEGNASEGKATLQLSPETPPGQYTLWFLTETKIKMKKNPEAVAKIAEQRALLQKALQDASRSEEDKNRLKAFDAELVAAEKQIQGEAAEKEYTVHWVSTPIQLVVAK